MLLLIFLQEVQLPIHRLLVLDKIKNNKSKMNNTFKHSVSLKINKKAGLAHLSLRTSEYKVEVFKLNISDIGSILMQFSDAMRDQDGPDEVVIEPEIQDNSEENTEIQNNSQEDTGMVS